MRLFNRNIANGLLVLSGAFLLTACATPRVDNGQLERGPASRPSVTEPAAPTDAVSESPAAALREQARAALAENDLRQAERLLARALRLDARDPATYATLSELRLLQNQPAAAMQLARKGLGLSPNGGTRATLKQHIATAESIIEQQQADEPQPAAEPQTSTSS